jgi:hypothetical protein
VGDDGYVGSGHRSKDVRVILGHIKTNFMGAAEISLQSLYGLSTCTTLAIGHKFLVA